MDVTARRPAGARVERLVISLLDGSELRRPFALMAPQPPFLPHIPLFPDEGSINVRTLPSNYAPESQFTVSGIRMP